MTKRPLMLASPEELRAISARAIEALENMRDGEDDEDYDHSDSDARRLAITRFRACSEALRFCALAAGLSGDTSFVSVIAEALDARESFDDHASDDVTTIAGGLLFLLRAGAPAGKQIRSFARSSDPRLRLAVATGLRPNDNAAITLLEELSADTVSEVRKAAVASLGTVREVAWWRGRFSFDPATRLSAEEAMRFKPSFERLVELLDAPSYRRDEVEAEIGEIAASLPDVLAVDLAEMIFSAGQRFSRGFLALGTVMFGREGGADAFVRVCKARAASGSAGYHAMEAGQMIRALAPETAERVCRKLAVHALAFAENERADIEGAVGMIAEAAGSGWPPGADLGPLLDMLIAQPVSLDEEEPGVRQIDMAMSGLTKAFRAKDADPTSILERAIEARVAGYPGFSGYLCGALDALLDRAPVPPIRAAAERAAQSDDEHTAGWGLTQILGRAYDPSRDPPPIDLARRLLTDPRARRFAVGGYSTGPKVLAPLREELRAGRLDVREATRAIDLIDGLWGGLSPWPFERRRDRAPQLAEARAKIGAFLGPEEFHGPVTEEEWRAYRAVRDRQLLRARAELWNALRRLPEGPWCPEDRAVINKARAALAEEPDLAEVIANALSGKPVAGDLPIFGELLRVGDRSTRNEVREAYRTAREQLGLPRNPEGDTGAKGEGGEWMDEEDDDEDDDEDDEDE